MKKVITYGTFDLLHYGHINLLRRAKALGDYLIVGVSSDKVVNEKGKKAYFSMEERIRMVEAIRYVDLVIPEESMAQKIDDIKEYKVDIFTLGDDYKETFQLYDEYEKVKEMCEIVYLERTPEISTTIIKKELNK